MLSLIPKNESALRYRCSDPTKAGRRAATNSHKHTAQPALFNVSARLIPRLPDAGKTWGFAARNKAACLIQGSVPWRALHVLPAAVAAMVFRAPARTVLNHCLAETALASSLYCAIPGKRNGNGCGTSSKDWSFAAAILED
jgi:hypothetical protein